MPIINIFTDYNNDPLYTSYLLGKLRNNFKGKIVESTHFLPYDNIMVSSFIIKKIYPLFPSGTVHLICTNTSSSKISQYLVLKFNRHYFVLADNGMVDLITDEKEKEIYTIPFEKKSSFAEIDIMLPYAIKIADGQKIQNLLQPTESYDRKFAIKPVYIGNRLKGTILYIDRYGNAFTNIDQETFERYRKGRKFQVWVNLPINTLKKINQTYKASPGTFNAIFNSFGYLELSVIYGNLAQMLQLKENESEVIVDFI